MPGYPPPPFVTRGGVRYSLEQHVPIHSCIMSTRFQVSQVEMTIIVLSSVTLPVCGQNDLVDYCVHSSLPRT